MKRLAKKGERLDKLGVAGHAVLGAIHFLAAVFHLSEEEKTKESWTHAVIHGAVFVYDVASAVKHIKGDES